ncbi:MAG: hypothetical protein RL336_1439 [Pseudomonadota bacterium]
MSDQLKIEQIDGVTVARLIGRIDTKCVQSIGETLKAHSGDVLSIDMSKVSFIDSSALGLIVSTYRRNQEVGSKFCLFGMTPQVRAVFELTRLHRIFDIFENEPQAMSAVA